MLPDAWANVVLQYGLIGVVCLVLCVVVVYLAKRNNAQDAMIQQLLEKVTTGLAKSEHAMALMADASDDRNKASDRMADALNRQAEATKSSQQLLDAQIARILDRFGNSDLVISAVATGLRETNQQITSLASLILTRGGKGNV
jgi:hypothetical protein